MLATTTNHILRLIAIASPLAWGLWLPDLAHGAPAAHDLTLVASSLVDTPFGLTSLPLPITAAFVVDDSILHPGTTGVIDELPGFSLLNSIIIGDATFNNASIAITPGGRVVDGALTEIFLHALFLDPVEGQRELTTYFFPAFEWNGTDLNPETPSEFVFGSYSVTRVPEPVTGGMIGLAWALFIQRSRCNRVRRPYQETAEKPRA